MCPSLIRVDGVSKHFGTVVALQNVSARLEVGSIGLLGPNGSGKTTLIRLLLGLLAPDSGALSIQGMDSQTNPIEVRSQIGYMPEHDCLSPEMTGVGFVAHMGRVSGLPKETAISRAHDVLQFVGLAEERYRRIREYSVGMRQRVKLAQAIVHDPPLCFLDEPTSGLDPTGREEMLNLIRALRRVANRSFVLSTHLLHDADGLCDQVMLLSGGRLLAAGSVSDLLGSDRKVSVVRVKGDVPAFVASLSKRGHPAHVTGDGIRLESTPDTPRLVFEAAVESGVQVRYLGQPVSTIEDLFMSKVEHPDTAVDA